MIINRFKRHWIYSDLVLQFFRWFRSLFVDFSFVHLLTPPPVNPLWTPSGPPWTPVDPHGGFSSFLDRSWSLMFRSLTSYPPPPWTPVDPRGPPWTPTGVSLFVSRSFLVADVSFAHLLPPTPVDPLWTPCGPPSGFLFIRFPFHSFVSCFLLCFSKISSIATDSSRPHGNVDFLFSFLERLIWSVDASVSFEKERKTIDFFSRSNHAPN